MPGKYRSGYFQGGKYYTGYQVSRRNLRSRYARMNGVKRLYTKRSYYRGRQGKTYNTEYKFHESNNNDATVAQTGGIQGSMNVVAQGLTETTRVGRKIWVHTISSRFEMVLQPQVDVGDISNGDTLRIILYLDQQANGAVATVTDILETAEYESFRNLANSGRFKILHDKFYTMNRRVSYVDGTNTSGTPLVVRQLSVYKTGLNIPIEYNGATGAVTEMATNNLSYLFISSQGICGVQNQINRIRYSD